MKDNYLFDRVCKECTKFEEQVSDGWWTYPVAKSLAGVYIDIMGDDGDCYDEFHNENIYNTKFLEKD